MINGPNIKVPRKPVLIDADLNGVLPSVAIREIISYLPLATVNKFVRTNSHINRNFNDEIVGNGDFIDYIHVPTDRVTVAKNFERTIVKFFENTPLERLHMKDLLAIAAKHKPIREYILRNHLEFRLDKDQLYILTGSSNLSEALHTSKLPELRDLCQCCIRPRFSKALWDLILEPYNPDNSDQINRAKEFKHEFYNCEGKFKKDFALAHEALVEAFRSEFYDYHFDLCRLFERMAKKALLDIESGVFAENCRKKRHISKLGMESLESSLLEVCVNYHPALEMYSFQSEKLRPLLSIERIHSRTILKCGHPAALQPWVRTDNAVEFASLVPKMLEDLKPKPSTISLGSALTQQEVERIVYKSLAEKRKLDDEAAEVNNQPDPDDDVDDKFDQSRVKRRKG